MLSHQRWHSSFLSRMREKFTGVNPLKNIVSEGSNNKESNAHQTKPLKRQQDQMVKLLKSTPKGEFNLKTTLAYYQKEQASMEHRLNTETLLPKDKQQLTMSIEQLKSIAKTISLFDPIDQEYPQFISERTKTTVSEIMLQSKTQVDQFVSGVSNLKKVHAFIWKCNEKGIKLGDTMNDIKIAMQQDPDAQKYRKRNRAGYLAFFYASKVDSRKKTLKPAKSWKATTLPSTFYESDENLIGAHNEDTSSNLKLSIASVNAKVNKWKTPQLEKKGAMFGNQQVSATRKLYEQKPIRKKWERPYTEMMVDVSSREWKKQ